MADIYTTTVIVAEKCWVCGVPFGLDATYRNKRVADGATFHCPNGHRIRYGQTETEILRKQLERERQATLNAVAATQRQRERTEEAQRRAAAARGVVTRIKRRVSKGICPCCNRTFVDLGKHMGAQHPEWSADRG